MTKLSEFIDDYYEDNEYFTLTLLTKHSDMITKEQEQKSEKYNQWLDNGKIGREPNRNFIKQNKHNKESINGLVIKELYQHNNTKNRSVYLSLNSYNSSEYRTKTDIIRIKSLFFDIDENAKNIVPKIIKALGSPSYLIQSSKYKYQLIYRFLTPLNPDKLHEYERISYTLTKFFETDPSTWDVTRIFRAPFTKNQKRETGALGFRTTVTKIDITYSLQYFHDFLKINSIEILDPKHQKNDLPKQQKCESQPQISLPIPSNRETIPQTKNKYEIEYNKLLREKNYDNSKADAALVTYLKTRNYPDEQIKKILLYCRKDWSAKNGRIDSYIDDLISSVSDYLDF